MSKAIIRIQKLKSPVAVRRSIQHAFRDKETPNADAERTQDNTHFGAQSSAEAMRLFNAALPEKVRKNGVLAVEYLVTGSPEALNGKTREEQDAYFADSIQWLKDKHGAENLIYAGVHRDETTPHLYAYVVPKDAKGKLNCRSFFGEKDALSKMQTNFAEEVSLKHGLERGLQGSRAHHVDIKQYYRNVNAATPPEPSVSVPEPTAMARINPSEYGKKVAQSVIEQMKPAFQSLQAKAVHTDLALKQAKSAEEARAAAEQKNIALKARSAEFEESTKKLYEIAKLFTPEEVKNAQQRKQKELMGMEAQKRIDALERVFKQTAGAAHEFAANGLEAIKKAGGDASKVQWGKVEAATIRNAIGQNGQSPESVVEAIQKHSPGRVNPADQQELRKIVEMAAPDLQKQYEKAHDGGPSLSR